MAVHQVIGKRVRELRQGKGLTQKELALKIQGKVDYSYIGKIERGEQLPSLKMLTRLSEALAVPLSYFFQGLDSDTSAGSEGLQAEEETIGRQQERRLRVMLRTVHNDDIPLLVEIVRLLNKHRKTQRAPQAEARGVKHPADASIALHAAESPEVYRR
ncbi:MAG: helix-turn-helix domain-containing protein [Candidatus Entotheonellia bacterium]